LEQLIGKGSTVLIGCQGRHPLEADPSQAPGCLNQRVVAPSIHLAADGCTRLLPTRTLAAPPMA
jgi:hypothetical protein